MTRITVVLLSIGVAIFAASSALAEEEAGDKTSAEAEQRAIQEQQQDAWKRLRDTFNPLANLKALGQALNPWANLQALNPLSQKNLAKLRFTLSPLSIGRATIATFSPVANWQAFMYAMNMRNIVYDVFYGERAAMEMMAIRSYFERREKLLAEFKRNPSLLAEHQEEMLRPIKEALGYGEDVKLIYDNDGLLKKIDYVDGKQRLRPLPPRMQKIVAPQPAPMGGGIVGPGGHHGI